jgi:hypothetical protein
VVDFYEYWEGLQEGWDGPALLVFSDGKKVREGGFRAASCGSSNQLNVLAGGMCPTELEGLHAIHVSDPPPA